MALFRFLQILTCTGALLAASSSFLFYQKKKPCIPRSAENVEFGLATTSPHRSSSSPFPTGKGLPRSELSESKFKVLGRSWYSHEMLLASNTYLGPTKPVQGNPQFVRVEVLIQDSADPAGPQVVSVELNKTNIPLKPRDIYGNRGSGSFQLPPGKYKLRWVTNQNKIAWPRKVSHEEEVTISPRDLWIQIQIEGESATIS